MYAPLTLVIAYLCGSKTWLHIQDFELDAAMKLGILPNGKWLNWMTASVRRFEHALLNCFEHISTISNQMAAHLIEKGVPQNKISILPNWVNTDLIFPLVHETNSLRCNLGLCAEHKVILYAGTMSKKQGLANLLIAAKHLLDQPQIEFVLCGEGPDRSELEESAMGLSNLRFLPLQPFENLNQLLNMADIHILLQKADVADLVMPSKLSGMLASGKAVIATAYPQTELGRVVNNTGVLVPPDNPTALAEAILRLSGSAALRCELGKLGREYAVRNWDATTILNQFEQRLRAMVVDDHLSHDFKQERKHEFADAVYRRGEVI
jgi:colanic acid biosynthesis glycosyl transferase WcaI